MFYRSNTLWHFSIAILSWSLLRPVFRIELRATTPPFGGSSGKSDWRKQRSK
ncbi:hypothetical protein AALO_G00268620 [Alosa alosa]|uniref:Uncharacterized protein n=1 Tax=Alosa alosa TaxID=278164 RepID=A0AAV6FQ25_9TELE|nr:hypothetical protein AALO_G00268620 [Alosa alosa]